MNFFRLAAITSSALVLVALASACGNSDDESGGTINTTSFCTDVSTVVSNGSCTELSAACKAAVPTACPTSVAPGYSAAFATALHACASSQTSCNLDPGEDACLFGKVIATPATPAQMKLATDFCTACVPGSTVQTGSPDGLNCSGNAVTVPQGYGRVMGVNVLALSDSAAATAERCVTSAAELFAGTYDDCESTFLNCIVDQRGQSEGASFFATCSAIDAGAMSDGGI